MLYLYCNKEVFCSYFFFNTKIYTKTKNMHSNYNQTWKNVCADNQWLCDDKNTGIHTFKLFMEIIISLFVVVIVALVLSWIDNKVSYQQPVEHDDIPTYTEHADQRFIRDFFQAGYLDKNITLSLK
ncbi:MAG: hypothetical protein ABIA91_01225 [Patescibacteria group bacterium]